MKELAKKKIQPSLPIKKLNEKHVRACLKTSTQVSQNRVDNCEDLISQGPLLPCPMCQKGVSLSIQGPGNRRTLDILHKLAS